MRALVPAILLSTSLTALAQPPAFEVASVKPSGPRDAMSFGVSLGLPGGAVRLYNIPLRGIIVEAYDLGGGTGRADVSQYRVVGGASGILARRFDIDAKASADADVRRKRAMLRTLIAERFNLRIHSEKREIPLYVLTVARKEFGPQFTRSDLDCVALTADDRRKPEIRKRCAGSIAGISTDYPAAVTLTYAGPISHLLWLAQGHLDRPLVDGTGLTGNFEWSTAFRAPLSDAPAPTIFDAFQRDFGLRIERRTGPFDVWVIDSVGLPTPN